MNACTNNKTRHLHSNKMGHLIAYLTIILSALSAKSEHQSIMDATDSEECRQWVDSVYNTMDTPRRIAQLFVSTVDPSPQSEAKYAIDRYVKEHCVGGLLFNRGNLEEFTWAIDYAQSVSQIPLMMTIDGEWGLSMRIAETPRFPHNMGLGAVSDEELLYEYGKEVARECREMGIHVNFAPVLDVNSNPDNPVIGYRSFGEDPERVSSLGIAYSRGLEDGGVLSVGKHFPGHGDTSVDSHKELPTVDHKINRLERIDYIPFVEYINAKLSGLMVGHLNVPALDSTGTPASLSQKITTDILRNKLGFNGLIFTDALDMKGAKTKQNNCVLALQAGADILLGSSNPPQDIIAVMQAVQAGTIDIKDIEHKCKKMLAYKYALGVNKYKKIRTDSLLTRINSPEADAVNRQLAAASMTVIFNDKSLLPIGNLANKSIAIVNIGAPDKNKFTEICSKYAKTTIYSSQGHLFAKSQLDAIKKHDIVIAGIYTDNLWARSALSQLSDVENLIPTFFINPYRMKKYSSIVSKIPTLLLAYDDTPYTQEYAAQAIFGGIKVNGRLPVNIRDIAPMGTGIDLPKTRLGYTSPLMEGLNSTVEYKIDSLVNEGLATKAFPGCQVLIAKNGNIIIDKSYGYTDFKSKIPVTTGTIYDLASVSKATGTLPGVMKAYDLGLFNLDKCVSDYIPEMKNTDKKDITVRELLYHESGMPASLSMFNIMMDTATYEGQLMRKKSDKTYSIKIQKGAYGHRNAKIRRDITSSIKTDEFHIKVAENLFVSDATIDTLFNRIYNAKLRKNKRYNYSCLNFCLLMKLEQNVTNISHDKWVEDSIYAPLGAYHTQYRPLSRWTKRDVAPTEFDSFLRRQTLHGYVHDELANMSGGIQGNAGLFSNANDLAKLCQMWLNGGEYGGVRLLSNATTRLFTTDKSKTCRRGLGFDKPDIKNPEKSPTAEEASASTFGHLGFTGTVFWVDPDNDLIYIFLCNRVNPSRDNNAFNELNIRPQIFSEVYKAM